MKNIHEVTISNSRDLWEATYLAYNDPDCQELIAHLPESLPEEDWERLRRINLESRYCNEDRCTESVLTESVARLKIWRVTALSQELNSLVEAWLRIWSKTPEPLQLPEDLFQKHGLEEIQERYLRDFIPKALQGKTLYGWKVQVEADENKTGLDRIRITKSNVAKIEAKVFSRNNVPRVKLWKLDEDRNRLAWDEGFYAHMKPQNYKDGGRSIHYRHWDEYMEYLTRNRKYEEQDILISEDSAPTFYGFNNTWFVTPTKAKVASWWNYDLPTLYKYETNLESRTNTWGLQPLCWSYNLVETGWRATYIAPEMTPEEGVAFVDGRTHTAFAEAVQRAFHAKSISAEELSRLRKEVKEEEKKVQDWINDNAEPILRKTLVEMGENPDPDLTLEELEGKFRDLDRNWNAFDCGNLYFTRLGDLKKKIALLAELDSSYSKKGTLNLRPPVFSQSTTRMRILGTVICSFLNQNLGQGFTCWTELD